MKFFVFLFSVCSFALHAEKSLSQNKDIYIKSNTQLSVEEVFDLVKSQTDYNFTYRADVFKKLPKVTLKSGAISLKTLLKKSLTSKYNFEFDAKNNSIIIAPNKKPVAISQEKHAIKGKVTDVNGEPLFGVTIIVKGKNRGTFTDSDGSFSFKVSKDDVLQFSYVGFNKLEVKVGEQKEFNIVLKEASSDLDEVQITAYGKTSQRLSTGNITTITAEQIKKNPVVNVLEAIKNTVTGVYIEQPSGQSGSAFNIKIRGQNSLTPNVQPLLIVDGVAMPIGDLPEEYTGGFATGNVGGSSLNYIDPNNVESINFLKDAEATSIYGSRGSNGVILITMKKGRKGAPKLTINTRNGFTFNGRSPKLLNTKEYIKYRTEALENAFDDPAYYPETNGTFDPERYTDFTKYFSNEPATTSRTNLTYSGGNALTNYLVTANYNTDKDMYSAKGGNTMKGLHFNLNTSNSSRKFSLGLTGTYSSSVNNVIRFDASGMLIAPNTPDFYNEDGSLNWTNFDGWDYINYARDKEKISENKVNSLVSNLNLSYKPLKGLEINTNLGYSEITSSQIYGIPTTYHHPDSFWETNRTTLNKYTLKTVTAEPNISYTTELGNYGNLKIKTGATLQESVQDKLDVFATDLISDTSLNNPTLADRDNVDISAYTNTGRYIGFFGRLNYNYANKYLLNSSIRYEGSTKFGESKRFGDFWSVSGAWILSEEGWFKDNLKAISFAKIRTSYGTSGGDNIPDFSFKNTYSTGYYYGNEITYYSSGPSNPNLHWENNKKFEIGATIGLFNDRIQISESFYNTVSNDQLIDNPVSAVAGTAYNTLKINSPAELRNWGHEITLSTQNIIKDNFTWTTNFNITFAKDELVSFPSDLPLTNPHYEVGKSVQGLRVYDYRGVSPETGEHTYWRDLNGDKIENDGEVAAWSYEMDSDVDRTKFINLAPIYYGSFNNSFTIGNFNVGMLFTFTKKQTRSFLGTVQEGLGKLNIPQTVYDNRWQQPGDITDIPKIVAGDFFGPWTYSASSGAYQKTFFARLQNLNLGYNIPSNVIKKYGMESLQLTLQGQNLMLLTDYKGYDPETLSAGIPPLKTFVLGVNIRL